MAVYKVPQDVEADDKLIGPFSFRQFIYLIIVAAAGAIAFFLGKLFFPLAILPAPVIIFFGALALPLRKDQPMETYLAAIVSFYLKPHRRMWDPDGQQALIEIVAPRVAEVQRTNGLSQTEAEQRLSYLANVVDTHGWAVRGVDPTQPNSSMNADVYYEAQQAEDVLDTSTRTAHTIENQLDQANARHRQELINRMQQPAPQQPPEPAQPQQSQPQPQPAATPAVTDEIDETAHLAINPYPAMQQSVIQPIGTDTSASALGEGADPGIHSQNPSGGVSPSSNITTSEKAVSPDIINLANNPDLSIETIAHEANRIKEKEEGLPEGEVIISLH